MTQVKHSAIWVFLGLSTISALLLAQQKSEVPKLAQNGAAKFYSIAPSQLKWTDPPAGVARGTPSVEPGSPLRYAAMHGDPLKPGSPFAIRLRCSDGYKAAPHWHPGDENIIVLQGTFSVGTGDRFDVGRTQDIPTGGYGFVPGRMNHFAVCKGETDILVYGIGPRINNWVSVSSGSSK
jgi:hypothetical protein